MKREFMVLGVAALALSGCAGSQPSARLSGAAVGSAAAPVRIAMTLEISHALDTAVRNQPVTWSDAEGGTQTQFTVLRMYQKEDGTYCREFTETVSKGSDADTAHGTACRQPDGTWQAVAG